MDFYGRPGLSHSIGQSGLPNVPGNALLGNIIAWWNLNEASGTREDSTGNYDLSSVNSVGSEAGKIGNAATFLTASDQSLDAGSPINGVKTFSCFVKVGSFSDNPLVLGTSNGGDDRMFDIFPNGAGTLGVYFTSTFTTNGVDLGGLSTGTYYHLVGTCDPDDGDGFVRVYLNGSLAGTSGASIQGSSRTSAINFRMGDWAFGAFTGSLDLVGLWSRVLSTGQINELYNGGSGLAYPF